jgi:anti-sigma-K factor RskA
MNDRDFDELSAAHALRALTPDEERALSAALAADPTLQARVDADLDAASRLAETVAEVVPPPAVRDALLALIAVTPQHPDAATAAVAPHDDVESSASASGGAEPGSPERARWGTRAWFALAACIVLVLGIGGAVAVVSQQVSAPASVVALERIENAPDAQSAAGELTDGGEATLHWSESLGEAVLVSDGLPSIEADRAFELWYVRDGAPISAGVFSADGGDATAILSGTMHAGDVVAVTVEQAGGSPDGTPTTDPIVAIATA